MKINLKAIQQLKEENQKLNDLCAKYRATLERYFNLLDKYKEENKMLRAALSAEDIIFPNTEERGSADTDTAADLSDIFES